jgi:HEAT repeat protein
MLCVVSTTTPDPRLGALVAEAEAIESWSTDRRYWDIVDTLVGLPLLETFGLSQQLCASDAASQRRLGAQLLAEMAVRGLRRHARIADDAVDELLLLTSPDEDDSVLACAVEAAGSLGGRSLRRAVLGNVRHPSPRVRVAVAVALPALVDGSPDRDVIRALIILTQDDVATVRDFATFSLGSQIDTDDAAVRDALRNRLDDPDESTGNEALIGLARRADPAAVTEIVHRLAAGPWREELFEAATELRDGALIPHLVAVQARLAQSDSGGMLSHVQRALDAARGVEAPDRAADHPARRRASLRP